MRWSRWVVCALGAVGATLVCAVGAEAGVNAAFSPQTGPGTYSFGKIAPGSSRKTTFHLENSGSTRTPVLRIAISGSSKFAKSTDTCRGRSLGHNQSCKVVVKFVPGSAAGRSYTATLAAQGPKGGAVASLKLTGSTSGISTACVIKDGSTTYSTLEAAQTAAAGGDTLTVKGTCVGNAELAKDLTITGVGSSPTLQGDGTASVLHVDASTTVAINSLTVTGGSGDNNIPGGGGGILNFGTLTLTSVDVTANSSAFVGGGITNDGSLTLDASTVSNNSSIVSGGIDSTGTLVVQDSSIDHNTANDGNAGIGVEGGTTTLEGTTAVSHNTGGEPGGVGVIASATLVMQDSATISDNSSDQVGGGIENSGLVELDDSSSITGNTAATYGGGIYNSGTVDLNDTSSVSGNTAGTTGGGIDNAGGTVTMNGGTVTGNTPDDCVGC